MLLWKALPTWPATFCAPVTTWPAKFWMLPNTPIGDVTLLVLGAAGALLVDTPAADWPAGDAVLAPAPLSVEDAPACTGAWGALLAAKAGAGRPASSSGPATPAA